MTDPNPQVNPPAAEDSDETSQTLRRLRRRRERSAHDALLLTLSGARGVPVTILTNGTLISGYITNRAEFVAAIRRAAGNLSDTLADALAHSLGVDSDEPLAESSDELTEDQKVEQLRR